MGNGWVGCGVLPLTSSRVGACGIERLDGEWLGLIVLLLLMCVSSGWLVLMSGRLSNGSVQMGNGWF